MKSSFQVLLIILLGASSIYGQTCTLNPVTITTQQEIDDFASDYPNCTTVLGNMTIDGDGITNLNGLIQLTQVNGQFRVINCPALTSLDGLDNLTNLNNCHFTRNDLLSDISALSNVTSITGLIFFSNNPLITDLDVLSGATATNIDDLSINQMANLTSIAGLSSISALSGRLNINDNPALTSLNGLQNIQTIAESFTIRNNISITSFEGLEGVTSIGEDLIIDDNLMLQNIDALSNLQSTTVDRLSISNNPMLSNIDPLSVITTVNEDLYLDGSALTNLNGLASIATVGEDCFIEDNPSLTDIIGLSNLSSINQRFRMNNNDALISLDGLEQLTSINGDVSISDNSLLADISGIENLTSINGDLSISSNDALTSLEGLDQLTSINGRLTITNNNLLADISGISNIDPTTINNGTTSTDLRISNNPMLSICEHPNICTFLTLGLETQIQSNSPGCNSEAEVDLACNPAVPSCTQLNDPLTGTIDVPIDNDLTWDASTGADGYRISVGTTTGGTDIVNDFDVGNVLTYDPGDFAYANDIFVNIVPYNAIGDATVCSEESFTTEDPPTCLPAGITFGSQQEINDFPINYPGCTQILGDVCIGDCTNGIDTDIFDLTPLLQLEEIHGELMIFNNPNLLNLNGLNNLTSIGLSLSIKFNDGLLSTTGLNALETIGDRLSISYNGDLLDLDGFSSLTSIAFTLNFIGNFELADITGLSNLSSVASIAISTTALTNLMGLENITSLTGKLVIGYNYLLTDLTALSNLTEQGTIGGEIAINSNDVLTNLDGLDNLLTVGGYIELMNNPLLSSVQGLRNVDPATISWPVGSHLIITGNPMLEVCEIDPFCVKVSDGSPITISGNGQGCFNATAIQDACNIEENYTMDFDGVDDYIDLDNIPSSFTYSTEMWVKFDQVVYNTRLLSATSTHNNIYSTAILGGDRIYLSVGGGGSAIPITTTSILPDVWYHIAIVRKSPTEMDCYLNGVNEIGGSVPIDAAIEWVDQMHLGSPFFASGNPNGLYLDGQIEEFRVWEGPITQADILSRMNTELTGAENNLVAYYKFDDDSSPNDVEDCDLIPYYGMRVGTGGPNNLPQYTIDQGLNLADVACDPCDCNPNNSPLIANSNAGLHVAVCKMDDGNFTHFCDGHGNLLLSLDSGTGSLVDPSEVSINITPGSAFYPELCIGTGGTQDGNCFISNPDGAAILCRTWDVNNPAANATLRYYFDSGDVDLINQELFNQGMDPFMDLTNLWFYKVTNGNGHTKPEDLQASDVQLILNNGMDGPTTSNWELGFDGSYYAEYQVASFSGGGGGGGNNGSSPACPIIEAEVIGGSILPAAGNTDISLEIIGGLPPYTIRLSDATQVMNYMSLDLINVNVTATSTFEIVGITDANGCPLTNDLGSTTVFVQTMDVTSPNAVCQDLSLNLDNTGLGNVTAAQVDNGSTDDIGIYSMELSQEAFDCGYTNPQMVTLTVYDSSGNMDQCMANITVNDPNMVCCPNIKNIPNTPSSMKDYEASQEIISDAEIKNSYGDTDILFKAGNSVLLDLGFESVQGAKFEVIIGPCNN